MLETALDGWSSQMLPLGGKRMLPWSFFFVWNEPLTDSYIMAVVSIAGYLVHESSTVLHKGLWNERNVALTVEILPGVLQGGQRMERIPVYERVSPLKQLSHLPYLLHPRPCTVWVVAQHPQPCIGYGSTRWLMISAPSLLFLLLFLMCLQSHQSLSEVVQVQNMMVSLFFTWLLACGTLEVDDLHNLP